jgi:hypothetical protein
MLLKLERLICLRHSNPRLLLKLLWIRSTALVVVEVHVNVDLEFIRDAVEVGAANRYDSNVYLLL